MMLLKAQTTVNKDLLINHSSTIIYDFSKWRDRSNLLIMGRKNLYLVILLPEKCKRETFLWTSWYEFYLHKILCFMHSKHFSGTDVFHVSYPSPICSLHILWTACHYEKKAMDSFKNLFFCADVNTALSKFGRWIRVSRRLAYDI